MQRHNTIEDASGVLVRLLDANPGLELETQIIVGFPSETQHDFEETLSWLGTMRLHKVTIFVYDEKENAPSREIQPKVPEAVIQERIRAAHEYFRRKHILSALSCNVR